MVLISHLKLSLLNHSCLLLLLLQCQVCSRGVSWGKKVRWHKVAVLASKAVRLHLLSEQHQVIVIDIFKLIFNRIFNRILQQNNATLLYTIYFTT